jgi:hypothetical protein
MADDEVTEKSPA